MARTTLDKLTIRNELATTFGIDFSADVHSLDYLQRTALNEKAKKIGYRKSKSAPHSLATAFFQYLNK